MEIKQHSPEQPIDKNRNYRGVEQIEPNISRRKEKK